MVAAAATAVVVLAVAVVDLRMILYFQIVRFSCFFENALPTDGP